MEQFVSAAKGGLINLRYVREISEEYNAPQGGLLRKLIMDNGEERTIGGRAITDDLGTIVPANAGFFVVNLVRLEGDEIEVGSDEVIAWRVPVSAHGERVPVTVSGRETIGEGCGFAVLTPSGKVESYDCTYPSIEAYKADWREVLGVSGAE